MSRATARAIDELSAQSLRARAVYLDSTYLTAATQPSDEHTFLVGELRARLLLGGVQLVDRREKAQIILEVRSGGIGIDRLDYLLGIPAIVVPGATAASGSLPLVTPELAIIKNIRQKGFAEVAFVAYWADTGELLASSGPFIGRTSREDWWFLGWGPRTIGDIPTTAPPK